MGKFIERFVPRFTMREVNTGEVTSGPESLYGMLANLEWLTRLQEGKSNPPTTISEEVKGRFAKEVWHGNLFNVPAKYRVREVKEVCVFDNELLIKVAEEE